jgi:hypothetical protein
MKFRFSIRDVLWLTLAVALCMGWLVSDHRKNEQLKAEKAAIKAKAEKYAELLRKYREQSGRPRIQPLAQR